MGMGITRDSALAEDRGVLEGIGLQAEGGGQLYALRYNAGRGSGIPGNGSAPRRPWRRAGWRRDPVSSLQPPTMGMCLGGVTVS